MDNARGVAVSLVNITKKYPNGFQALHGVDLAIEPGEWLVLVGPSGCGKTTLLRIIAGLEEAAGTVQIDGRDANHTPPWRRNLAMAFQRPALAPSRTVGQNLALGVPQDRFADLSAIAEMLDLGGELDRLPHQLSGGQQQRVALGRALARPVPLYLLDEPLGHLDAPLRDDLRGKLRLWHERRQATVISVTHDPGEAWALGDRVVVMDAGRMLQIGPPAEVHRKPCSKFVARFFAQGPMNFWNVQLRKDGNSLQWRADRWPYAILHHGLPIESLTAVVGLRAEDVLVGRPGEWTMHVKNVEPSPHGYWVTGEVDGRPLVGWSEQRVIVGDKASTMIDWTKAYWFDATTDATVCAPAG